MTTITKLVARDVRAPTSRSLAGSDASHPDPDYSAAYVVLETDRTDGLCGHGMTFTIGRGNDLCVSAANALAHHVVGRELGELTADMAGWWRAVTRDSQLRWLGPEKGVIHLATAALVNAVWDLWAKTEGKPVWKLVVDMTPEQLVACVDFRYLSDVLTPDTATELLRGTAPGGDEREAEMRRDGYPAYITSVGWLGYPEDELRRRCRDAVAAGWERFKIKVGVDPELDARRCAIVRDEIGGRALMVDANQVWDVPEAIERMRALARFDVTWIEEPTSPDDVLGHAAIRAALAPLGIGVATGEHCPNRVMFKQLLQAGSIDYCQVDACRLGGLNEVLAVLLLAARFGVPVCPHAGGLGLCEYVQHIALIDYIAISGRLDGRATEFADHLHEHFVHPVDVRGGRYRAPTAPGFSIEMRRASLAAFEYPTGSAWA